MYSVQDANSNTSHFTDRQEEEQYHQQRETSSHGQSKVTADFGKQGKVMASSRNRHGLYLGHLDPVFGTDAVSLFFYGALLHFVGVQRVIDLTLGVYQLEKRQIGVPA